MSDLLREFVRGVLITEAAVSAEQAGADGLALYVIKNGMQIEVILYDPAVLLDGVLKARDKDSRKAAFEASVIGDLLMSKSRSPCNKGWEITNVAAEDGFGPLIHDIAMSVSPTGAVVPDRDNISSGEHAIFSYYMGGRRKDVTADLLDNRDDPQTPPETDDCEVYDREQKHGVDRNPLNYSYSGAKPDTTALVANHKSAWTKIKAMIDADAASAQRSFQGAGSSYFNTQYKALTPNTRSIGVKRGVPTGRLDFGT